MKRSYFWTSLASALVLVAAMGCARYSDHGQYSSDQTRMDRGSYAGRVDRPGNGEQEGSAGVGVTHGALEQSQENASHADNPPQVP